MKDTNDFATRLPLSRRAATRSATAEDVRELRDACGWTPEQMAKELGVLPAEVVAWEAGTVAPSEGSLLWLRWHAAAVASDRALHAAGATPCAWIVANRERLALRAATSAGEAWYARRELCAHREGCAECRRVEEVAGSPSTVPDLLPMSGVLGLRERMDHAFEPPSWWLRLAFRAVGLAVLLLGFLCILGIWDFIEEPSAGLDLSLEMFPALYVICATLGLVHEGVRRWDDEHPALTAHARVAAVAAPGTLLACAYSPVATFAEVWWFIPVATLSLGWLFARQSQRAPADPTP